MNKIKLFFGACVASVLCTMNATAQLTLGTEIRPRGEVRAGYKDLYKSGENPAEIFTQRTRLNVGFKTEKIKTYFSFQNVSIWGEQSKNTNTNRTATSADTSSLTNICEGWAELNLCKYSALRVGRQLLAIEDERLLSSGNWGQAGQSLDGVLYHFDNDSIVKIRVFASYNNEKDSRVSSTMISNKFNPKLKTFNFIELKKDVNKNLNFTLLGILSAALKTGATDKMYPKNTFGAYVTLKNDDIAVSGSGFYQNGQNSDGKLNRAFLVNAQIKYTKKLFEVIVGVDLLSGNDMTKTDADYKKINHKCDVLLGTTRPFQGTMELVNTKTSDAGLFTPFFKSKTKITENVSVGANYFFLKTQNNVGYTDGTGTYVKLNKYLGQEGDLLISYKINSDVTLDLGYTYLYASHSLKVLKKAENAFDGQNWAWVQLTFKPKLFEGALKN